MEPSYLFLLSYQDLISSYLIVYLIFHLISDYILSCLMMPSLLQTHGLHMYLILLTDTYCALLCIASRITHVEHSRIPYLRIPWNCLTVIACTDTWQFTTYIRLLVYIVFFSCILLRSPSNKRLF